MLVLTDVYDSRIEFYVARIERRLKTKLAEQMPGQHLIAD
jgi:hypothetical protein